MFASQETSIINAKRLMLYKEVVILFNVRMVLKYENKLCG